MSYYAAAKVAVSLGSAVALGMFSFYSGISLCAAQEPKEPTRQEKIEEAIKDAYRKAFGAKF